MEATATVCPKCGKTQTRSQAASGGGSSDIGKKIGSSAGDAFASMSAIIMNPVGGLAPAFEKIGADRGLFAGIALGVVFALVAALGTVIGTGQVLSMIGLMMGYGESGFGMFIRAFIGFLVLPAAMIAASFGARKVFGGSGPLGADGFTVGAALTPLGIAILLSSLLGVGNYEIAMLLMLFAMTYLVLMLYAGLTRLGGLTERAGAPAVPIVFVVSLYICKVVFSAMLSPV
jgi:hypothetical protein